LSDIYHILLTTSHRAKATQDFLQNVVLHFISVEECPTHSSDTTNPLDYSVWDILEELLYEGRSETICKLM